MKQPIYTYTYTAATIVFDHPWSRVIDDRWCAAMMVADDQCWSMMTSDDALRGWSMLLIDDDHQWSWSKTLKKNYNSRMFLRWIGHHPGMFRHVFQMFWTWFWHDFGMILTWFWHDFDVIWVWFWCDFISYHGQKMKTCHEIIKIQSYIDENWSPRTGFQRRFHFWCQTRRYIGKK